MYNLYTVLRIDSSRTRRKAGCLVWKESQEISLTGLMEIGREEVKRRNRMHFKPLKFTEQLDVGYEIILERTKNTCKVLFEYLEGWSCYELRWTDWEEKI